ncbi:MAG: response regulator transcription factor [Rubrivivax sp.]|nr:response regulator transcription factor [Rubrivivax sp.]
MSSSPVALRVALLEDEPGTLQRLAQALHTGSGVQLSWVGASVAEALERLASNAVDVLLVGLRPGHGRGLEGMRRGRGRLPEPGAPAAAAAPRARRGRSPRADARLLTPKEAEVLALVARGFSFREIARRLEVSLSTVRTHVRAIYAKLDVHSKTEAVFEARAQGLL